MKRATCVVAMLLVSCGGGAADFQQGAEAGRQAAPATASASAEPRATPTPPPAVSAAPTSVAPPVAATTQPRIVAPQPARVVITSQSTFCNPARTTGTVRNDGGASAQVVSVTARIFLSDGRLWSTATALTSPATIPAGGTASFEAFYSQLQICLQGVRGDVAVDWAGGNAAAVPLTTSATPAPTSVPTTAAPTPTAAPTATPAPTTAAPTATPTAAATMAAPTQAPTPAVLTVRIANSQYGTLGAITLAGASCTARARLPSGNFSDAGGLQPTQVASSPGAVNWSYGTSSRTTPGTGTHTVTCTYQGQTQTASAPFTVQ